MWWKHTVNKIHKIAEIVMANIGSQYNQSDQQYNLVALSPRKKTLYINMIS